MKKFLAVLALVAVMTSCKSKKADDKKADETSTTSPGTTTTSAVSGVPSFSDPEIQKFANDYAAFLAEYKAGMKDPAKLEALGKNLESWQNKGNEIGVKLAANPAEAQKWAAWWMQVMKDIMPNMVMPEMK